jgi:hypothetical protein
VHEYFSLNSDMAVDDRINLNSTAFLGLLVLLNILASVADFN